ncbi:MAG: hypothetical protein HY812_20770 [Planctomycetes bacterium]|nr:hypothetical protein [Planctomycetota bacterium]
MDYPLRSIAYLAELIHIPRQHKPADLQKIHSLAFSDERCQYQNFALIPGGATLSNPQAQANMVSAASFLPDRVQVREEMSGISREDFQQRVERLSELALEVLEVQHFLVQNFIVRSLVNAQNYSDSREFLSRAVLNMVEEDFACLERMPQIVGLRLVFPQTSENRGMFNIRVESYAAEPRSLFIENVGVFRSVVNRSNVADLTSNFFATYDYIDENIVDFIAQFDGREEEPPKE